VRKKRGLRERGEEGLFLESGGGDVTKESKVEKRTLARKAEAWFTLDPNRAISAKHVRSL